MKIYLNVNSCDFGDELKEPKLNFKEKNSHFNESCFNNVKVTQIVAFDSILLPEFDEDGKREVMSNFNKELANKEVKLILDKLKKSETFNEFNEEKLSKVVYETLFCEKAKLSDIASNIILKLKEDYLNQQIKDTFFFGKNAFDYTELSKSIYYIDYVKRYSKSILSSEFKLDISEIISYAKKTPKQFKEIPKGELKLWDILSKFCDNYTNVSLCFDNSGIHSVKFDFEVKKPVDTPKLIDILDNTCNLTDALFFKCLKKDLEDNGIIKSDSKEHLTYSVISTTDAYINHSNRYKEILGISWKYPHYEKINKKTMTEIIENDVAIKRGDILTVTTQATLMILPNDSKQKIDGRINAIELMWRQKVLFGKINLNLDDHISDAKEKKIYDLEEAIQSLKNTQLIFQSQLELYRNIGFSVIDTYSMLFGALKKVFDLDNQYKFIQEKLNACEAIYTELHEERRNQLMDNIQWIVFVFGVVSFLWILISFIYKTEISTDQKMIITGLAFISLIVIFLIYCMVTKKSLKNIWGGLIGSLHKFILFIRSGFL